MNSLKQASEAARTTLDQLRRELLDQRTANDHWVGELAGSALSTATAVSALSAVCIHSPESATDDLRCDVRDGLAYLEQQQNDDGGFGDTDRSDSNIATSYLAWAASQLAAQVVGQGLPLTQLTRLQLYVREQGELEGLRRRYGKDKTFVVPIMTNMAIAGLIPWDHVLALPFEAAAVPQSMYRLMRMPVVSYAVPALVAIGQARHFHGRRAFWPLRSLRASVIPRTMHVLRTMQPESGGYLEATPLTSFVVMSLAATGRGVHPVVRDGVRFLRDSKRSDGSWPIDTNLATWVTSLAIHALRSDPADDASWLSDSLVRWHLGCQHRRRHPFTGAPPGGWGWTDLSGAVPDGDDTPAAILALLSVRTEIVDPSTREELEHSIRAAITWLLGLQNRDGGWPTFCRGWGKLPFDRSSTDLTAHAIRAIGLSQRVLDLPASQSKACSRATARGETFLEKQQRPDGSWLPLWFGNQDQPDDINPVYGTGRVLLAASSGCSLSNAEASPRRMTQAYRKAASWLIDHQNPDGGWGGGPSVAAWFQNSASGYKDACQIVHSTVEETAIAVEGLAAYFETERAMAGLANKDAMGLFPKNESGSGCGRLESAIIGGVDWLVRHVAQGRHHEPWPIGFYFAKLWYHEQMYPTVFAAAALGRILKLSGVGTISTGEAD